MTATIRPSLIFAMDIEEPDGSLLAAAVFCCVD